MWRQIREFSSHATNRSFIPNWANSYTAAIRNAISLGGDADTMACMAGGIAIATKGMEMPEDLAYYIYNHVLDDYLRHVLYEFNQLSPL